MSHLTPKTAIIPVGGYGTRFLPLTKVVPKELLPLGHKPLLLHAVESLVHAGIEHIVFIIAPHKFPIEQFFSRDEVFEEHLLSQGLREEVEYLRDITDLAKYSFVLTKPPMGNGGCILAAEHLVPKGEPFVVTWGDEVILTPPNKPGVTEQCLESFKKHEQPVIAAVKIPDPKKQARYGMGKLAPIPGDRYTKKVVSIKEKPKPGTSPSNYAVHNTYVLPYDFFDAARNTPPGKKGELWMTDILNRLSKKTGMLARTITNGVYYDCGNADNYVEAQALYAKQLQKAKKGA